MDLKTLAVLLNKEFGSPFLPDGFVRAKYQAGLITSDGTLRLYIGRRDVHFKDDGEVLGAGTCLSKAVEEVKSNGQ